MQSLEQQLPAKLLKSNANKALLAATKQSGTGGRKMLVESQHLDKVHKMLKVARQPAQKDTEKEAILRRYHKPPPLERPATPRVGDPEGEFGEQDPSEVEVAAILLQRLLRGR